MGKEMKPIAMRCNQEQFESIKETLERHNLKYTSICDFKSFPFLVNNYTDEYGVISNVREYLSDDYRRQVFNEWDADKFLEYCGIETETKTENNMKTIITAQELLEIHKIACISWKEAIKIKYFPRINGVQTIVFSQDEVNEMFKAANPSQMAVLEKIFGKQVKPIEWDRIKTGSQVMIERTGEHCGGIHNMDLTKPVDVIFYKTPHFITHNNNFGMKGYDSHYCTFHQGGKYVLFAAHENTDYITKVIKY
jgi:hypothetical protein